jgi:colanic acid/amylovoran biosynthesis glycosyltransferase
VAGIPELVKPGQHGWLVPAGDVVALATAIQLSLTGENEELIKMGQNGQHQVRLRHDADQEANKLIALLQ